MSLINFSNVYSIVPDSEISDLIGHPVICADHQFLVIVQTNNIVLFEGAVRDPTQAI